MPVRVRQDADAVRAEFVSQATAERLDRPRLSAQYAR
jgi:hypothetical protein